MPTRNRLDPVVAAKIRWSWADPSSSTPVHAKWDSIDSSGITATKATSKIAVVFGKPGDRGKKRAKIAETAAIASPDTMAVARGFKGHKPSPFATPGRVNVSANKTCILSLPIAKPQPHLESIYKHVSTCLTDGDVP